MAKKNESLYTFLLFVAEFIHKQAPQFLGNPAKQLLQSTFEGIDWNKIAKSVPVEDEETGEVKEVSVSHKVLLIRAAQNLIPGNIPQRLMYYFVGMLRNEIAKRAVLTWACLDYGMQKTGMSIEDVFSLAEIQYTELDREYFEALAVVMNCVAKMSGHTCVRDIFSKTADKSNDETVKFLEYNV